MATKWHTIKVPAQLYEEVQNFIAERSRLGYTSVPNFIVEATREKLMKETQYITLSSK